MIVKEIGGLSASGPQNGLYVNFFSEHGTVA